MSPTASIIIPTRGRPGYLDIALASIAPQAAEAGAEVVVALDGRDPRSAAVARHHGATVLELDPPRGANAARNAGVAASSGPLVVLVDDDVVRSEEHTSELQSPDHLVCRLLLEKKKNEAK